MVDAYGDFLGVGSHCIFGGLELGYVFNYAAYCGARGQRYGRRPGPVCSGGVVRRNFWRPRLANF